MVLAFVCMIIVIQNVGAQEFFSSATDFARLYMGVVEPQYQTSVWYDIPYYNNNTKTYKGRVSYYGVVYDDVQLRFDQFMQRVVVLSPVGNIFCLPEQAYIDWFEMDGHRYEHDPEDSTRYASLLSDGRTNGIRLYHSVWKVYSGKKHFEGKTFLNTLVTKEHFTLMTADGEKHRVKRASDIVKLFPEQKKQIRQFSKKNRLSFSKSKREVSLVKVVESVEGTPMSEFRDEKIVSKTDSREESNLSPLSIDESKLITGIPVLDIDSVANEVASAKTKIYIVPGMKKAKASVADDQELDEIVVVGGRQSTVDNIVMGSEKFKPQLLKNIPSAFGESDIMKIVLTLPGVTTVGEASSGYNVRGGATDQNLILFNGGTVYNPSHLFGLFTSFNSDAVEDVVFTMTFLPPADRWRQLSTW